MPTVVIPGSKNPSPNAACPCGWKYPKEVRLVPAGMLNNLLSGAKATIAPFVESISVTCPGCGTASPCGAPRIQP